MRSRVRFAIAVVGASVVLSGCAYKPLEAPCSPDEGGQPLSYADSSVHLSTPEPFRSLDRCGPMKPI